MRRISMGESIRDAYGGGQTTTPYGSGAERREERLGRRVRAIREGMGLTRTAFAERVGVSQPTVTRWELDQDVPGERHLQRLAAMIGISVPELRYGRTGLREPVMVVGYVGPEAEVVPLRPERRADELEHVPALPGLDEGEIFALRVRADGAGSVLREGWLVLYRRAQDEVTPDCLGQMCVACLGDGRLLLREVRTAARRGGGEAVTRFDLHACDGRSEVLAGQRLRWASRVVGFRAP